MLLVDSVLSPPVTGLRKDYRIAEERLGLGDFLCLLGMSATPKQVCKYPYVDCVGSLGLDRSTFHFR